MAERARIGIDWGKARIGVAASAAGTSFAFPVETVPAEPSALSRLVELVSQYQAEVVYVGMPLTLAGQRSHAAEFVIEQATALAARLDGPAIRLIDERMSTAGASRSLSSVGRNSRQQRRVIDQAAAVEILQRALDQETTSGRLAGQPLLREDS